MKATLPGDRISTGFSFSWKMLAGYSLAAGFLLLVPCARGEVAAIASRVFNGYTRMTLPDKSFKPETFAFAKGGRWDAPIAGDPINHVTFEKIIHTLARPLADRGYVAASDPATTDLMIFVSWGTTQGSINGAGGFLGFQEVASAMNAVTSAPAGGARGADGIQSAQSAVNQAASDAFEGEMINLMAENHWRDKINERNAIILGYQFNLERAYMTEFTTTARDLFDELQYNRYFVVLKAYDFQLARKEKKKKVLWETRFSIYQQGNDFAEQLAGMAQQAARYFGTDTNGLAREFIPEGRVILGESKVLEDKPTDQTTQPKAK